MPIRVALRNCLTNLTLRDVIPVAD